MINARQRRDPGRVGIGAGVTETLPSSILDPINRGHVQQLGPHRPRHLRFLLLRDCAKYECLMLLQPTSKKVD